MPSSKTFVALLILSVSSANGEEFQFAEVQLKGACPKIRYITNLNLPRILGWYYRAFSNTNNSLCYNNEGQTMYLAQYDATRLNAVVCCRSVTEPNIPICGSSIGSGFVTHQTSSPGAFTYQFGNNIYPIYVLDTDYGNFTIIYGCKSGSKNYTLDEVILVVSRDYGLSPILWARARTALRANRIQWTKAKPVQQGSSIPYTPFAKQCQ